MHIIASVKVIDYASMVSIMSFASRLLKKGLYLNKPELAIISVECGFTLKPNI